MANPRVFISSTYYDLKHVRNDIEQFLNMLGYEAVMHDKGGVAYTQDKSIEQSCYHELTTCDIVVCIIGNKFGTVSEQGDFSITMKELNTALKAQKKVFVFIQKDVAIENRTFFANREVPVFHPVAVDNIKIHEYIIELKNTVKIHPIIEFDNVSEIIDSLRKQFAGILQSLLRKEASLTEASTVYDLKETSDEIKQMINDFNNEKEEFFNKFDGTVFFNNRIIYQLKEILGFKEVAFFIRNKEGIYEFMDKLCFKEIKPKNDKYSSGYLSFYKIIIHDNLNQRMKEVIRFDLDIFDEENKIRPFSSDDKAKEVLKREEFEAEYLEKTVDDDELPF